MIDFLCQAIGCIPLDSLQLRFMQMALLSLLVLSPMTAALGVEIVHFRMSFYSDAIGHSAFAGAGLGILLSIDPHLSMPLFGIAVGLLIIFLKRHSAISSDVAIGVVFSAVVAFGLAVVSQAPRLAANMQQFLFGDILTISEGDVEALLILLPLLIVFQAVGFNPLLSIALNPVVARAHGTHTGLWQYLFAAVLALIVIFSVWAVGVLLVTAMLVVPAAAARNIATSTASMFRWAVGISVFSSFVGLILSAQPWLGTASGATIILVCCLVFVLTALVGGKSREA